MYIKSKGFERKVFCWALLFTQIFVIVIFITFNSLFNGGSNSSQLFDHEFAVQFLSNNKSAGQDGHYESDRLWNFRAVRHRNVNSVQEDFFGAANNATGQVLCFRDGSIYLGNVTDNCKCKSEYHGRDCSQPEVLWRAFMTSKVPLNLSAAPREQPQKMYYMIHTTSVTIDTIEQQIFELINVVDLVILCDQKHLAVDGGLKKEKTLKEYSETGLLKTIKDKLVILSDHKCSPKSFYRAFRRSMPEGYVSNDDILLFSQSDEILNWRAVKYFKWYDNWPQPAKFRLKYTVFGYFWQHPEGTMLGSGACQISILDEIYKSDPNRMVSTKKPGIIVGDLNFVGGWYCQYCYHPLNIVLKLLNEKKEIFVKSKKTSVVDSDYIEHLIGNGLFVDGKLGLTRLHRYSDKYYAPEYVTNSSRMYENVLTNIYANYDDDEY